MRPALVPPMLALVLGTLTCTAVLGINRSWLTPGAHRDAVHYLHAAETMARDGTLRVPEAHWASDDSMSVLSHYPPGFPALISIPMRWGVRAHPAALWTMAVSAGLAMAGIFILVEAGFGLGAGLLTAGMLICTPSLTRLHLAIWAEPSFLAVTFAMLYLAVVRPQWHLGHGVLAAAGLAVRYVGVAGSIVAVLWALARPGSPARRAFRAALAGAPSAAFMVIWHHYVAEGGGEIRKLGLYGGLGQNWRELGRTLRDWLSPAPWDGTAWTAVCVMIGAVLLLVASWRKGAWHDATRRRIGGIGGVFALVYCLVVLAARAVADPAIPWDERLLSPVLVLATAAVASAVVSLRPHLRLPWRAALFAVLACWCVAGWTDITAGVRAVNAIGRYYTWAEWISDPVIRWLDNEAAGCDVLFSNEPALIFYHTGRVARQAPVQGENLAAFADRFGERPSALVIFQPLHREDLPGPWLASQLGLSPVRISPNAVAYIPPARPLP